MRKRKQEAVLSTKSFKNHSDPEKYFHAKLLLYYPWTKKDDIIEGFASYQDSFISNQETVCEHGLNFNEDSEVFDLSDEDVKNNIPQSAWDAVVPSIAQEDAETTREGFNTLQQSTGEVLDCAQTALHNKNKSTNDGLLSKLYAKAAKVHNICFHEYCKQARSLNAQHQHIVMYNRAWYKSYINAIQQDKRLKATAFS